MRASIAVDQISGEDWALITPGMAVVLDGGTARTATGCRHGVAWYTRQLGAALTAGQGDLPTSLYRAIEQVSGLHRHTCDLDSPATPSAAVGVVRVTDDSLDWLLLGDVAILIRSDDLYVIVDERVSATAVAERAEADRHPIGTSEKAAALLAMKRAELAVRNRSGGYWIAAADPHAVSHAMTGTMPLADVSGVVLLTDGAGRAVSWGRATWEDVYSTAAMSGPAAVIDQVRGLEVVDPVGDRWPRNKCSDDATVVYIPLDIAGGIQDP